jgi:glycine/D-amino acid oxidase-like deaminating enzyme
MNRRYDALVIGAGIVGAACALELAKAKMRVAVVEREGVGSGATAAAMGHIVVMADSEAQFLLTSYSQSLWAALSSELPASVECQRPGTIWIASDEEEMAEVVRKFEYYTAHGVPVEVLDAQALAEAEPNLRRPLAGGLRVASDMVLDPLRGAEYLLQTASVDLMPGQTVVTAGNGRIALQNGTELESPVIINATGAFAPALAPGIAVRKRKGHLILTDRYPGFVRHQLVELGYLKSAHSSETDSVAFNIQPRKSGQLLIGSSRQFDVEDPGIDRGIVASMIERASLYMPEIAKLATQRVQCGFRAATPDKLPLIGPTEDPSIFLATGHEGLGITTSLATARLLADHILGRLSAIPIEPYLPSRFAFKICPQEWPGAVKETNDELARCNARHDYLL